MRTSFQICILSLVALIIGVVAPRVNAQCTGDVIPSGIIDGVDLAQMLSSWGPCANCPADIDGDGVVTGIDLGQLLAGWGPCAPFIASVAPSQGTIVGGTPITISGAYFTGATSVTIGGELATNMIVVSSTTITAVTPAHAAGSVSITITTPSRATTLKNAFSYTAVSSWATLIETLPDPEIVTDATLRAAIAATGLPWRVLDSGTNIEMLLVPSGIFVMGCSPANMNGCNSDENPTHQVTLTQPFYMGRYEVTQAQWQAKMGSNPSVFQPPYGSADTRLPVEQVDWYMAQNFNTATGLRLPTEAEWEYAYRAGTTTAFHSMIGHPRGSNENSDLAQIAFILGGGYGTHLPGGKDANGFGLHDMSGNVMEWCHDWYGPYSLGSVTDPNGPLLPSGPNPNRMLRGGGFYSDHFGCRASSRYPYAPQTTRGDIGFRVARNP